MIMKDWVQEAANEIADDVRSGEGNEETYREIITKHCPMLPHVAYMPVPRCDSCKHWASHTGACTAISIDAPKMPRGSLLLITTGDFGCVRWKEKA